MYRKNSAKKNIIPLQNPGMSQKEILERLGHHQEFFQRWVSYPFPSIYGILTDIYHKNQPNVGKSYTIHESYGLDKASFNHSKPEANTST